MTCTLNISPKMLTRNSFEASLRVPVNLLGTPGSVQMISLRDRPVGKLKTSTTLLNFVDMAGQF